MKPATEGDNVAINQADPLPKFEMEGPRAKGAKQAGEADRSLTGPGQSETGPIFSGFKFLVFRASSQPDGRGFTDMPARRAALYRGMFLGRPYLDRREAGQTLAACLRAEDVGPHPVVLALPRGGVPVAAEVAEGLDAPLEVFLVRRLGFPGQPGLAMGAIVSGGVQLLDEGLLAAAGVPGAEVAAVIEHEHEELRRQEQAYRPRRMLALGSRPAIVVDDGLATGFRLRAAVAALRRTGCSRITVALPVGAEATCAEFARDVDLLVCPLQPPSFTSVGRWYEDFSPVTDEEVHASLARVVRATSLVP